MNKPPVNVILKICAVVLFLTVSVLWLISVLVPDSFGGHSLAWLLAVFGFGLGILFIVKAILQKDLLSIRKFYAAFGGVLLAGGICALIGSIIPAARVLPIIAVALSAVAVLSVLFVQGKKWDAGDNQSAGYKTYRERKAEEEAQRKNEQS